MVLSSSESLEVLGSRFCVSRRPEAVLHMPMSCATLGVNKAHTDEFPSASLLLIRTPREFIERVRASSYRPADQECHCEAIHAIDILNVDHCLIELMYKRASQRGGSQQGINFVLEDQNERQRIYQIYLVTGDLASDEFPHAFCIRLEQLHRFKLVVETIGEDELLASVLRDDQPWDKIRPQSWKQPDDRDSPYLILRAELAAVEGECLANGNGEALKALRRLRRNYAERGSAADAYPQNSLLVGLLRGSDAELPKRLRQVQNRILDGPAVIDPKAIGLRSQLEKLLTQSAVETYSWRSLRSSEGLEKVLNETLLNLALMEPRRLQEAAAKLPSRHPSLADDRSGDELRRELENVALRAYKNDRSLLVTIDRILDDMEHERQRSA